MSRPRPWVVIARDFFAYMRAKGWNRVMLLRGQTVSVPGVVGTAHPGRRDQHANENTREASS